MKKRILEKDLIVFSDASLMKLRKKLKVSNKRVFGMIEALLRAGYGKSEIAFLTQSGQSFSLAMGDIEAHLENEKLDNL